MIKRNYQHSFTGRGLLGVLCLVIGVLSNYEIVRAESTTDDLKSYLGITVEKTEEKKEYIVINNEKDNIQSNESSSKTEETLQIDIERKNLNLLNVELNQLIISDASPYDIISKINNIKETKNNITDLGYEIKIPDINNDTDITDNVTIYKSDKDINSRWYNIGDIGDNLRFCVDNFEILKPYGYLINYTNEDKTEYKIVSEKNNGIWIKCNKEDDIKSLFNGKIYSIESDEQYKGAKNICIEHGNGVYTIYRHLSIDNSIHRGDYVTQYQIIGKSAGMHTQDNICYIELQVIIDKSYINPILLFGNSGKTIYNKYKSLAEEEYVVEYNEYYYYDESISIVNPNRQ